MPRYDDDDDEDDRPRRRTKRKPAGLPLAVVLTLAGGAGLLVLALFGAVGYFVLTDRPAEATAPAAPAPPVTVPGQAGESRNEAPTEEPLPAGRQELTVTQVSRLRDRGEVKLQVQYDLTRGQDVTGELCVAVRWADGSTHRLPVRNGFGRTELPGASIPRGSVDLSRGWLVPEFAGTLAVWVERGGLPDGGPRISNVFHVRF